MFYTRSILGIRISPSKIKSHILHWNFEKHTIPQILHKYLNCIDEQWPNNNVIIKIITDSIFIYCCLYNIRTIWIVFQFKRDGQIPGFIMKIFQRILWTWTVVVRLQSIRIHSIKVGSILKYVATLLFFESICRIPVVVRINARVTE